MIRSVILMLFFSFHELKYSQQGIIVVLVFQNEQEKLVLYPKQGEIPSMFIYLCDCLHHRFAILLNHDIVFNNVVKQLFDVEHVSHSQLGLVSRDRCCFAKLMLLKQQDQRTHAFFDLSYEVNVLARCNNSAWLLK